MRRIMLTISAVLLLSFLMACDMASGISTVENSVSTTENSINSAENKQEDGGGIEGLRIHGGSGIPANRS